MLNMVWMTSQVEMTKAEAATVSAHLELGMWIWEQVESLKELETDVLWGSQIQSRPCIIQRTRWWVRRPRSRPALGAGQKEPGVGSEIRRK